MKLSLAVLIGARYVVSPRDFLSSVASLAVLGLAFSIAILLVVQAVLSGFEYEFRERVLGIMPHVTVYSRDNKPIDEFHIRSHTSTIEGIVGESLGLNGTALLVAPPPPPTSRQNGFNDIDPNENALELGKTQPVILEGIQPSPNAYLAKLLEYVNPDELLSLQPGSFEVLLGVGLAETLGLTKGDFATLLVANDQVSLVGFIPRQKRVRIAGLVETETFMDSYTAYIHGDDAGRFLRGRQAQNTYRIRLEDPFGARKVAVSLQQRLGTTDFVVRDWGAGSGARFHGAIMSSRYLLLLVFSLLVAVAAFNLVSTVGVMVSERRRDIAVLRTLGSDRWLISLAFLTAGLSVSVIGLILGCTIGFAIGWLLEVGLPWIEGVVGIDLLSQYFIRSLSVKFAISDFANVLLIGFGLCVIAIVVPAVRAARQNPTEILRHD